MQKPPMWRASCHCCSSIVTSMTTVVPAQTPVSQPWSWGQSAHVRGRQKYGPAGLLKGALSRAHTCSQLPLGSPCVPCPHSRMQGAVCTQSACFPRGLLVLGCLNHTTVPKWVGRCIYDSVTLPPVRALHKLLILATYKQVVSKFSLWAGFLLGTVTTSFPVGKPHCCANISKLLF